MNIAAIDGKNYFEARWNSLEEEPGLSTQDTQELEFYTIRTNPRAGSLAPILVPIAYVSHLTLSEDHLVEIFRLANQYTLNTPYPLGDHPLKQGGLIAYRPNHNGTHSARQAAHTEAIFDLVQQRGSDAARSAYASLSEEERLNLLLAAYFLRSGRVDEGSHLEPPVDDYNTRSALIYEQYAKQLGVGATAIEWGKKLITNSCKPKDRRDRDIDENPKNKFGFETLSMAHELDLVRCFASDKMEHAIGKMRRRLDYFLSDEVDPERYMGQLLQHAKDLCEITGCSRAFDNAPGDRGRFAAYSRNGDDCWRAVKSALIPRWL